MKRTLLSLAFLSFGIEAAKLGGLREFKLRCLTALTSPFGQRLGNRAYIGYRGVRGIFAFASRTTSKERPKMLEADLKAFVKRTGLSTEDQDLNFAIRATEILWKSTNKQNVSHDIHTSAFYASEKYYDERRSRPLDYMGFLLKFELPEGARWDMDTGFYDNDATDTEIPLPAEVLEKHDPVDLVYKVVINGKFFDPEDPNLPSNWKKDLRDMQKAVQYLAKLEEGFSGESADQRINDFLSYVRGVRAQNTEAPL